MNWRSRLIGVALGMVLGITVLDYEPERRRRLFELGDTTVVLSWRPVRFRWPVYWGRGDR